MKMQLYSIYDVAPAVYARPFCARSDEEAKRLFIDNCVRADSDMGAHPEHYSLVSLGSFNDADASIDLIGKKTLITGSEAVALSRKVNGENGNA